MRSIHHRHPSPRYLAVDGQGVSEWLTLSADAALSSKNGRSWRGSSGGVEPIKNEHREAAMFDSLCSADDANDHIVNFFLKHDIESSISPYDIFQLRLSTHDPDLPWSINIVLANTRGSTRAEARVPLCPQMIHCRGLLMEYPGQCKSPHRPHYAGFLPSSPPHLTCFKSLALDLHGDAS